MGVLVAITAPWIDTNFFREHIRADDWPNGLLKATLHNDYWGDGLFLQRQPTRIRRVERWRGRHLDTQDIHYYACLRMSEDEFQRQLEAWKSDPIYRFRYSDPPLETAPDDRPSWFPNPPRDYIGTITDKGGWVVSVYRADGDDNVYLHL